MGERIRLVEPGWCDMAIADARIQPANSVRDLSASATGNSRRDREPLRRPHANLLHAHPGRRANGRQLCRPCARSHPVARGASTSPQPGATGPTCVTCAMPSGRATPAAGPPAAPPTHIAPASGTCRSAVATASRPRSPARTGAASRCRRRWRSPLAAGRAQPPGRSS